MDVTESEVAITRIVHGEAEFEALQGVATALTLRCLVSGEKLLDQEFYTWYAQRLVALRNRFAKMSNEVRLEDQLTERAIRLRDNLAKIEAIFVTFPKGMAVKNLPASG